MEASIEVREVWQNRIVDWGTSEPDQLLANPKNFRRHPNRQREALRGSLNELDIIAPVIVNRVTGRLIDGHARVEEYISAGVPEVPVAYVDLTEEEEALALLTLDPISAMAVHDTRALSELLAEVDSDNAGLQDLLTDLRREAATYRPELAPEFGSGAVTDEDLERAQAGLGVGLGERTQVRVLCPHCAESFYVDAVARE